MKPWLIGSCSFFGWSNLQTTLTKGMKGTEPSLMERVDAELLHIVFMTRSSFVTTCTLRDAASSNPLKEYLVTTCEGQPSSPLCRPDLGMATAYCWIQETQYQPPNVFGSLHTGVRQSWGNCSVWLALLVEWRGPSVQSSLNCSPLQ